MTTADLVLTKLEPYKLKSERSGQWRCNSPFRPGANSHSFTVNIDPDGEHGSFFDHVSQDKGSLYDLAKRLDIPLPDRAQVADTKRIYSGLADYAAAHGLQSDDLIRAGWRETMKDDRPALAFKTKSGERFRFLDGKKPTYKSPQGYKRCWYGLNSVTLQRVAGGQPLVIANGEISALVGHIYFLASIAVTGGEREIPPELLEELRATISADIPVIVALDCDQTGRNTARLMVKQLQSAGYQARAVDLKLSDHGDLADFCMLHMEKAEQALIALPGLPEESAIAASKRRWRIVDLDELNTLPPAEWLIKGELVDHGLNVLYGPSGVGKSFFALDYGCRLAAQTHHIIYMLAEGESGAKKRVAAWRKHNKIDHLTIKFCLGAVHMMDKEDLTAFIEEIRPYAPRLVIIDTLARAMTGNDENSTRDMGMFVEACDDIKRLLNCAVLLIHHTGKVGEGPRGNSSLVGAADMMIRLSGDDNVIRVECTKTKDEAPFQARYHQLLPVTLDDGETSVVVAQASEIKQTKDDPLTINQRRILDSLILETFTNGATIVDMCEATSIARGSLYRTLSNLIYLRFVERADNLYSISRAGRSKLNEHLSNYSGMTHDSCDSYDLTKKHIPNIEPSIETYESHESLVTNETGNGATTRSPKKNGHESSHESSGNGMSHSLFDSSLPPKPMSHCPVCGESDWIRNVFNEWVCRACIHRIEETQEAVTHDDDTLPIS